MKCTNLQGRLWKQLGDDLSFFEVFVGHGDPDGVPVLVQLLESVEKRSQGVTVLHCE